MALIDLINAKKQQIDASKRPNAKRVPEGRSRLRILPSWRKPTAGKDANWLEQFWHDYGQHFIKSIGSNGQEVTEATYICVDRTFGHSCEVCKAISDAASSVNDDALSKLITGAKAGARILVNALHIDGQAPNVPEVYELPPTLFEQFIGLMQLYLQDGVNVLDLKEGFDVSIERTGKGLNTKYTLQAVPKSTSIDPSVMDKLQDLDKYVAQENEANRIRAIGEVRKVAGITGGFAPALSAPGHVALPASTANLLDVEEDLTQQIPMGTPVNNAPVIQEAVLVEASPTPAQVATAQVAATVAIATAQVASATSGDDELDNLLAELNA